MKTYLLTGILLLTSICSLSATDEMLVWPPAPDQARIAYIGAIECESLELKKSFFGKVKNLIAGKSEKEFLSLPFDIEATEEKLFVVFQNIPALIEIDKKDHSFHYRNDESNPFVYPIAVSKLDDNTLFITDVQKKSVFRYHKGKVEPFVTSDLIRPTGIAVLHKTKEIVVIDTGEHALKFFDYNGRLLRTISEFGDENLHFPTFVESYENSLYLNDGLNYKIKRLSANGNIEFSFGSEGDSPGTFARPKGIALDSKGHIYVVDNLFDNVQVFDSKGHLLLVIGSRGQLEGQFWSPAGIAIYNDTIFIADTFNNRIQMFKYLGDTP